MKPGRKAAITAPPLDFSEYSPRGWRRLCEFCDGFLRVPKGKGAKQQFVLRDWQITILQKLFPEEGDRPRSGLLALPRGNGKSAIAAVIALYCLFADEVEGAQVLIVASDERQARIVFNAAKRMIELEPRLSAQVQVYHDKIYVPHTDSTLAPMPAEPGALQGWDPSACIIDELHVVTRDVFDAMMLASGKREDSLLFAISTPVESEESVMYDLVKMGREDPDPSFALIEYAAPAGCALDDRAAWAAANPALGDFLFEDAIAATLRTTREPRFRTMRLGQWVGRHDQWLPFGAWAERADASVVVPDKTRVVLGFDGSASGDSTALVAATCSENPHVFVLGHWANPGDERWRVDRADVDRAVALAHDRFEVVEQANDPWGWRSEIQEWQRRFGENRVIELPTSTHARMGPATDLFYSAVVEGRLTHDGDSALSEHIHNAVAKTTPAGDVIVKDARNSVRKIDLAVAAIVAHDRAVFHASQPRRRSRVAAF